MTLCCKFGPVDAMDKLNAVEVKRGGSVKFHHNSFIGMRHCGLKLGNKFGRTMLRPRSISSLWRLHKDEFSL